MQHCRDAQLASAGVAGSRGQQAVYISNQARRLGPPSASHTRHHVPHVDIFFLLSHTFEWFEWCPARERLFRSIIIFPGTCLCWRSQVPSSTNEAPPAAQGFGQRSFFCFWCLCFSPPSAAKRHLLRTEIGPTRDRDIAISFSIGFSVRFRRIGPSTDGPPPSPVDPIYYITRTPSLTF